MAYIGHGCGQVLVVPPVSYRSQGGGQALPAPPAVPEPQGGGQDVFVHISAVERAGLSTLNEGQHVEYEVVSNRGKSAAENLKVK